MLNMARAFISNNIGNQQVLESGPRVLEKDGKTSRRAYGLVCRLNLIIQTASHLRKL